MNERTSARRAHALLRNTGLLIGFGMLAAAAACGDKSINGPAPVIAVTTLKDSTFNFTGLNTFSMPDTVVQLAPLTGTPLAINRQFDHVALDAVRRNLLARGYVENTNPAILSSFVVLVGATATTNYNAWVGYPWFTVWGFYPNWAYYGPAFDSSWTIVYPWYGTVGVTAYDRGTLIVDMIPTVTVQPVSKSVRSVWAGVATATLIESTVNATTVSGAVDAMFAQSPYLVAGPVATPHD